MSDELNLTIVAPPPGPGADPSEAAFRRAVQSAFDVIRFQPRVPSIASIDLTFNPVTDTLYLKGVGGPNCKSARFQIDDDSAFGSPSVNVVVSPFTQGDVDTKTLAIVAANRDKVWYGRIIPYSGPAAGGKAGTALQDSEYIPLSDTLGYLREDVSEAAGVGTLTLTPYTGAPTLDSVEAKTQEGNGAWSVWAALAGPPYVETVNLVERHVSKIAYRATLSGNVVQENVVTFDLDTLPNAYLDALAVDDSGNVTADISGDSDMASIVYATSTVGTPSDAATRAGAAANGRKIHLALGAITAGQTLYFACFAYTGLAGAGVESAQKLVGQVSYRTVPAASPALTAVRCTVYDDGADDTYTVTWTANGSVTDGTHDLYVIFYRNVPDPSEGSTTFANAQSGSPGTYVDIGAGDGVSDLHWAEVFLMNGSNCVASYRTKPEMSTI